MPSRWCFSICGFAKPYRSDTVVEISLKSLGFGRYQYWWLIESMRPVDARWAAIARGSNQDGVMPGKEWDLERWGISYRVRDWSVLTFHGEAVVSTYLLPRLLLIIWMTIINLAGIVISNLKSVNRPVCGNSHSKELPSKGFLSSEWLNGFQTSHASYFKIKTARQSFSKQYLLFEAVKYLLYRGLKEDLGYINLLIYSTNSQSIFFMVSTSRPVINWLRTNGKPAWRCSHSGVYLRTKLGCCIHPHAQKALNSLMVFPTNRWCRVWRKCKLYM